jgi:hypothetical protein
LNPALGDDCQRIGIGACDGVSITSFVPSRAGCGKEHNSIDMRKAPDAD